MASTSAASLVPAPQARQPPNRPQSAAARMVQPSTNLQVHRSAPALHQIAGQAAGSLSRVVSGLRPSTGEISRGAMAAWSVDVAGHVDALRALQKRLASADLAKEDEAETVARATRLAPTFSQTETAARREAATTQRRHVSLISELESTQIALRDVTRKQSDTAAALATSQRLLTDRSVRARELGLTVNQLKGDKLVAEARLDAAEVELAALKVAYDDLQQRTRLASYMRAAPGLRTTDLSTTSLPMPPETGAMEAGGGEWPTLLGVAASAGTERAVAAALRLAMVSNGMLQAPAAARSRPKVKKASGVHKRAAAAGIRDAWGTEGGGDDDIATNEPGGAEMATKFLMALSNRDAVANVLCNPLVAEAMVTAVWAGVQDWQKRQL